MTDRRHPTAVDIIEAGRQTQAERREAAERAILEAAKIIVAERGLDELTLSEAGEAAGYSRALPAHYFRTKSALVSALADQITSAYAVRMRESFRSAHGLDQICECIAHSIDDGCRDPITLRALHVILSGGLTKPELRPLVQRLNAEAAQGLATLFKRGQDKGDIRADINPHAEASLLMGVMRGLLFQWLIDPDRIDLPRMRDALVSHVRKTLAP